jgi:Protein of unknown function (DUF2851)
LFCHTFKKALKVFPVQTSFYSEWRLRNGVVLVLHEDRDSPPERLLQAIWQHQRLLRDQLKTLDNEPVRVLHPGFQNREAGPDFHDAVLQIGSGPPHSGDIEVDLQPSGWRAHGHDRNPAFGNVVLHVVWESERPASGAPPTVLLRPVLDAPLGELSLWLGSEAAGELPPTMQGACARGLRELPPEALTELLRQAAQVRLESKAARFQARARQAGWEQSLWEGLFRALGYKNNVWPMQHLAELRPRWWASGGDAPTMEARLFGISGLLPVELPRSGEDDYVRGIWDRWWRERDAFSDCLAPRELWRLNGLRPPNHPQRRLALASCWSADARLVSKLEQWCGRELACSALAPSLLERLEAPRHEFWSWHWTFRSKRLNKPQPLLGASRATDLAVNVILPWLWIRAVEGQNEPVRQGLESRYFSWPPAQDNSVLRKARRRMLGGVSPRGFRTAACQQGMTQIVQDYCSHSNALCENCRFPELVREFRER